MLERREPVNIAVLCQRRSLCEGVVMSKSLARCSAGVAAALFCATLFAPAVSSASTGDSPLAQEGSCADVQVVFARGIGEPPGPGRVGRAFVDSLRSLANGKSVAVYAVDYPVSYEFLRAVDGADDARRFIESTAVSCPQTKVVIGGYSQGAAIVDLITVPGQATFGFGDPLPDNVADHDAAVAVFGNPSNRVGGPLTALSPLYGFEAIDLCNGSDPVCSNSNPVCSNSNDVAVHRSYVEDGMTSAAAQFFAHQLAAG